MKKIKEAIINADPRMKGLLVVMIAYIGICLLYTSPSPRD